MDNKNSKDGQPKVSIIIPVYNVEKYIRKCLDSVVAQTLKDIEIILIDDGATDSSGKICDEYAENDDRIIVIHDANHGVSHARNKGLDAASGEYIGFVDSDDYIEADMFEYLYDLANDNQADLAQCGVCECYKDRVIKRKDQDYFNITDSEGYVKQMLDGKHSTFNLSCRVIKRKAVGMIRFRGYRIGEDAVFNVETASAVKTAVLSGVPKYYYIKRQQSMTTKSFSTDVLDYVSAVDYIYDLVRSKYPKLKRYAAMRRRYARLLALDTMYLSDGKYDKRIEAKIIKFLRKRPGIILFHKSLTIGRRLAFVGLLINKNIYKTIIRFYNSKQRILMN